MALPLLVKILDTVILDTSGTLFRTLSQIISHASSETCSGALLVNNYMWSRALNHNLIPPFCRFSPPNILKVIFGRYACFSFKLKINLIQLYDEDPHSHTGETRIFFTSFKIEIGRKNVYNSHFQGKSSLYSITIIMPVILNWLMYILKYEFYWF